MHADVAGVDRLSGIVIGCAFRVMNRLGAGFAEKVYENALAHELRKGGLAVLQQQGIAVPYDGIVAGEFVTDLLIDDTIVVELKAVRALDKAHMAQCINYLTATGLHLCLLLNFGKPRVDAEAPSTARLSGQRSNGTPAHTIPRNAKRTIATPSDASRRWVDLVWLGPTAVLGYIVI